MYYQLVEDSYALNEIKYGRPGDICIKTSVIKSEMVNFKGSFTIRNGVSDAIPTGLPFISGTGKSRGDIYRQKNGPCDGQTHSA